VFRRVLGEPANAASELRAALPPAIVDRLDLDQLAPVPGTFVDTTLSYRHTDLLFTAPLEPWLDELRVVLQGPDGREVFTTLLRYIGKVGDTEVHDPLRDLIAALGPEAEEAYVTIAEMLEARGLARGRAEVLVELLTLKFGPLAESVVDSVHKASADQIRTWTARVLTAQTLDQLFR
jgi:hypothetical protein